MDNPQYISLKSGDIVWLLTPRPGYSGDRQIYQTQIIHKMFSGCSHKAINFPNKHLFQPLLYEDAFLTRQEALDYADQQECKLSYVDPPSDKTHEHIMEPLVKTVVTGYVCECGLKEDI